MAKGCSQRERWSIFVVGGIIALGVIIATTTKTADKKTVTYPQNSFASTAKCTTTFIIVSAFTDQVQPSLPAKGDSESDKEGANCGKIVVEKKGGKSLRGAFLVNNELELVGKGNTFIDNDHIDKIEFTVKRGTDIVLQQEVSTKLENGGKRGKAFLDYTPTQPGTYSVTIRAHSQTQGWVD